MKNKKIDNYYVPEFSFGSKAVIRPLPTSCLSVSNQSIKTLKDLKNFIMRKSNEKK